MDALLAASILLGIQLKFVLFWKNVILALLPES